jgi:hypothetical protein
MNAKFNTRHVADASTSNAGDDFHLQWAARRALALLKPGTDLTAILPENPTPPDAALLDPTGEQLLAIDLTEYYGGESFQTASRVVYSQLKYSTKSPNNSWTIASLIKGKKSGTAGSVVHRLYDLFCSHFDTFGRDLVISKLRILLVSNRPASPASNNALKEAQKLLEDPSLLKLTTLLGSMSEGGNAEIKLLASACKTRGASRVCDFLRILDLSSHLGQASRFQQEMALTEEIGQHGFDETSHQRNTLKALIWDYSQPGKHPVITSNHVLRALKVFNEGALFPASSKLESNQKSIPRKQASSIAKAVVTSEKRKLCLHGNGGFGKTTLMQQLKHHLPIGSIVVLFDCYGGGNYQNAGELRHQPEHALTQICNELAVASGTGLLLNRDLGTENLIRWLISKSKQVAAVCRSVTPEALVAIVIDAADNSIAAAKQKAEKSFVTDLITCAVPDGCRLIFTTRSHRRSELIGAGEVEEIELAPFDMDESRENLELYFKDFDEDELTEFHRLSGGVPRVQGYALEKADRGIEAVLSQLRPDGKTLDTILNHGIEEAVKKCGDRSLVSRICEALVCLSRPAPVEFVSYFAGAPENAVNDVVTDLGRGLICGEKGIQFRDEDFEAFLSSRFETNSTTWSLLADLLMEHGTNSAYAAASLPEALFNAKRYGDLINLVHEDGYPKAILDPVARKEAFARRTRLAVYASVRQRNRVAFFRLLFTVAQANKSDRSVESLLLENVDLAFLHGDPATIQQLYLNEKNDRINWYGATHMRCAGLFARNKISKRTASKHLEASKAWLVDWMRLPTQERHASQIDVDDIAYMEEANFRLHGFESAVESISRWRPNQFAFDVSRRLASRVAKTEGERAFAFLGSKTLTCDQLLVIIEASIDVGIRPPERFLIEFEAHIQTLCRLRPARRQQLIPSIIRACEAAAIIKRPAENWLQLLKHFLPPPVSYLTAHLTEEVRGELDLFLRARSLLTAFDGCELEASDVALLPVDLHEKEIKSPAQKGEMVANPDPTEKHLRKRREEQLKQYASYYGALVPVYVFRTNVLFGAIAPKDIMTSLDKASNARGNNGGYSVESERRTLERLKAPVLIDAIIWFNSNVKVNFDRIYNRLGKNCGWDVRLNLAERASLCHELQMVALALLDSISLEITESYSSGQEKTSYLVRCCRIASVVDATAGQHYFNLAVEAAAEIDDEAFGLLRLVASLAERARADSPSHDFDLDASQFAQLIEECHWRLEGWNYFPWEQSIQGLTHLSASISASCISRWDQDKVISISESASKWAVTALSTRAIQPEFTFGWNLLSYPGNLGEFEKCLKSVETLRRINDRPHFVLEVALKALADYATRESPVGSRASLTAALMEWAATQGLMDHEGLGTAKRFWDFLNQIEPIDTDHSKPVLKTSSTDLDSTQPPHIDYSPLICDSRLVTAEQITALLKQLDKKFEGERRGSLSPGITGIIQETLEAAKERPRIDELCLQLDALMEVDSELLDFHDLINALSSRLKAWKVHPAVRAWFLAVPPRLAKERFNEFFSDQWFSSYWLEKLKDQLEIPIGRMLECLIDTMSEGDQLRHLSSTSIYDFGESLVSTILISGEAADVLSVVLPELTAPIQKKRLAVGELDISKISSPGTTLEASFLWFLFGHPDKRVRWRAVHAARKMVCVGHIELVSELAKWLDAGRSHPYAEAGKVFYWLAARQWFFLLLDRLSAELPATLVRIAPRILREAVSPNEPHALIMQFAKRAAINLVRYRSDIFDGESMSKLVKVLVTPFKVRPKGRRLTPTSHKARQYNQGRFDFDSMDTLPYWYVPLARVFDVGTEEVCLNVENWVCDEWKFTGSPRQAEKERRWTSTNDEWELTSHRHGSEPIVETLRTYLEFNGMLCAAASLLKKHPVKKQYGDGWDEWLRRWDVAEGSNWATDFRQAPPLEPVFYRHLNFNQKETPDEVDFDRAIGFKDPFRPGFLVVNGDQTIWDFEGRENINIWSALVSAESAQSLLFGLYFSEHSSDYRIPNEGDELEIDETIGGLKFSLKGWVVVDYDESYGIESHDPLRFEFKRRTVKPGSTFLKWSGIHFTDDHLATFRPSSPNKFVTLLEEWNDFEPGREQSGLRTSGSRLWISIVDLLDFLTASKQSLIAECDIDRRYEPDRQNQSGEAVGKATELYLIHGDGTVETTRRSYSLGKTPSPRTRFSPVS